MIWLIFAIISCLSFGVQSSITYYLTNQKQLGSAATNTVYHIWFVLLSIVFLLVMYLLNQNYTKNILSGLGIICSEYLVLGIVAGIMGLLGNSLIYESYALGKQVNPGIITGISSLAIVVSTLLAFVFFSAKISIKQIIGIGLLLFSFAMLGDDSFPGFRKFFQHKKE